MKLITIDPLKSLPKYKQIILSIETAIAEKRLKRGDHLPSVNKIALEFSLSRDTVLLAYDELKKRGIIYSRAGKGYYIKSEEFAFEQRIFLLFDEFNSFKEDLYNAFKETIGNNGQIDIFFHYFSLDVFKKLVNENNGDYTKYVIMPTILKGVAGIIKTLPQNDVYILDQTNDELQDYPSIHQNHSNDIYKALAEGRPKLGKYKKLILIFPDFKQPPGMQQGFIKFCQTFGFEHEIIPDFANHTITPGDVYIIPNDRDLVNVIEQAQAQHLKIGREVGIISYNDTPLKKVVEKGITTISTDFMAMGKILAEMILNQSREQVENKSRLIVRHSL
ncbi:GntR family transcriptional regulator [Flavobacterium sp. Sd200]|uniref:GntR family transcriptional regulator n=1 Tax=Flavobacterium sp. Sd200 TaxID=2692211 RepID=UPI00136D2C7F|nr:GntR family transcriptional regulator [Flavobacterium sp. Sd200]MXN92109.1 GntR family transcriptional regulator [Flavobacterium sp. Sd200]